MIQEVRKIAPERNSPPLPGWPPAEGAWFDVMSKAGLVQPIEHALVRYTGVSLVTWATRVNRGLEYIPTLLLTTVGRRSGRLHEVALGYHVRDARVILIGSYGGGSRDPQWYHNLVAHPLVWLTINRKQHACDTYTATGADRDAIWASVCERVPEYLAYERRASRHDREMPVVVCEPRAPIAGLRAW